jgi:hypothetical protein
LKTLRRSNRWLGAAADLTVMLRLHQLDSVTERICNIHPQITLQRVIVYDLYNVFFQARN